MAAYELDHLAIAVEQWDQARPVLSERLRGRWAAGFRTPPFDVAQIAFAADMRLELLQPGADPSSFVRRFLQRHSPAAPHHITFKVDDIEETFAAIRTHGFEPILIRIDDPYWREGFLHPADTGLGFLVQVVEAPQDVTDFEAPETGRVVPTWSDPQDSPRAIPAIVGDVLDWEQPTTVLQDVLGAEVTDLSPTLRRFRWPAGADLLLQQSDRSGIQTVVVADAPRLDLGAADLPVSSTAAPLAELGLRLLDLTDHPAHQR